ncbi:MAG: RsmE family RNA methyltransferase [Syntrophorhabdales bacterium]|jgi:16S rRNA (uracil1498-N3)-methyltransferase
MEVRRIFVDKLKMKNGMVLVTGPSCKYILTVLRKVIGERIDVMDGKGYLYRCMIHSIKGKELYLTIMDAVPHPEEKRAKVTLLVSPIKGPRMDWLVEKATELGVDRIVPTIFRRTVVRFQDGEAEKCERWKRIMIEASRQSGRFSVPELGPPTPLRGVLPYIDQFENRWLLYEREESTTMKDVFVTQKNGEVCVAIGPEGGIEDGEAVWFKENGFISCTLGEKILRTETTPLVVLSIIFYELSMR